MKHFRCIQGAEEWRRLRMGKPTASSFDRLITPKKWEPTKSDTRRGYAIELLTELILDMPLQAVTSASLQHGTDSEEKARAAYEMQHNVDVEMCGFITDDACTYGSSPDGLIGTDGSLELKCPFKPETHVEYMLRPASLSEEYFVQTQGQLFVTRRKWTDLNSYFVMLPSVTQRVTPHPEFQEKLAIAVHSFCAEFSDLVERAVSLGYLKNVPALTDWIRSGDVDMVRKRNGQVGDFDLTDQDVERIWEAAQTAKVAP